MHMVPSRPGTPVAGDHSQEGPCSILGEWNCETMGISPVYLHSPGDILWNLVSVLRFPLWSHTFPVLGYCAICAVPLIGTLSQDKGVGSDNRRVEPWAFLAPAMLYRLDVSIAWMLYPMDNCVFPFPALRLISACSLLFCLPRATSPSPLCLPSLYCSLVQDIFPSTKFSNTFIIPG